MDDESVFPMSEALEAMEFRGRTWCFTDLTADGGFSVSRADAVFFHTVLHGELTLNTTSGSAFALRTGDAVVIMSGEAHAIRTNRESRLESCNFLKVERERPLPDFRRVGGSGPLAARLLSGRLRSSLSTLRELDIDLALPIRATDVQARGCVSPEMIARYAEGNSASTLLTRCASLIITEALRDRLTVIRTKKAAGGPVDRAIRMIDTDPRRRWSVALLAREVGMSRSSFAAHFTEKLGMAPMAYVTKLRMQRAEALLRHSAMPIADIAEAVGYASEVAFIRRFTRFAGQSPSGSRHHARQEQSARAFSEMHTSLLGGRRRSLSRLETKTLRGPRLLGRLSFDLSSPKGSS